MAESDSRHSAEALDEFLRYLAEKGLMAKQTVVARRAAANKMLGILDPSERGDVRNIDLDEVATRFNNLEGQRYTPDSLKTYKSRVSKAIEDFERYLDNPAGFKVNTPARKKPDINAKGASEQGRPGATKPDISDKAERSFHRPVDTLSIPIPIRPDAVVTLSGVPFDLKESEAKKIANVVLALGVETE